MDGSRGKTRQGFRISARTILHLGSELISSDGIAIYELAKNAFDAGSPDIRVEVTCRIPHDTIQEARERLAEVSKGDGATEAAARLAHRLAEGVISGAPGANELTAGLLGAETAAEVENLLDEANEIRFVDTGHGMSLAELSEIYLRVGTPSRLLQRRNDPGRVILGEKGIGRLSAMRLGSRLFVETTRSGEERWHVLRIDWREFERDLDQMVEDIPVAPEEGRKKDDRRMSGTTIQITALRANWTEEKLRHIAATDLSRATDPFSDKSGLPIRLRFNGNPIPIDRLSELLFRSAHAVVTGEMRLRRSGGPVLRGHIDYRYRGRNQEFRLERNDLYDAAGDVKPFVLDRLGPFRNVLLKQFKPFIDHVDEEVSLQNAPTVEELEERFGREEAELHHNVARLRRIAREHPEAELAPLVTRFARQAVQIRRIIRAAADVQQNVEKRRDRLLDLAGLGLMAEILAHELNRSVVHALRGLGTALSASGEDRLTSLLRSAEAQLKSLQKRVTVLDSLSTTGRQRTHKLDVGETVREVFAGRAEQFERHGINASVVVNPQKSSLVVRMVKGMLYQIIENLIENSVYWLKTEKKLNAGFKSAITARLDVTSRALFFSDNGPGIDPVNADQVFLPFFSLKKRGKGLGLFVSREYARDQGADLTLSRESDRGGRPRLLVVLHNAGADDLTLNLGLMLGNGRRQLPTAVRLALTGPDGKRRVLRRKAVAVAGRVDPFGVPLAAGCRYVLACDLGDYCHDGGADLPLAPGRYRVSAEFAGEAPANTAGLALMHYWTGAVASGEVRFLAPDKP